MIVSRVLPRGQPGLTIPPADGTAVLPVHYLRACRNRRTRWEIRPAAVVTATERNLPGTSATQNAPAIGTAGAVSTDLPAWNSTSTSPPGGSSPQATDQPLPRTAPRISAVSMP